MPVIPPNWPVVMVPIVLPAPVENTLMPIWVSAVRSTSANLTSSSTSSAPTGPKVSTFTTFLEYAEASEPACLATSSVVTWPERTIALARRRHVDLLVREKAMHFFRSRRDIDIHAKIEAARALQFVPDQQ